MKVLPSFAKKVHAARIPGGKKKINKNPRLPERRERERGKEGRGTAEVRKQGVKN